MVLLTIIPNPANGLNCKPFTNSPLVGKVKFPNKEISFSIPTFVALDLSITNFLQIVFFIVGKKKNFEIPGQHFKHDNVCTSQNSYLPQALKSMHDSNLVIPTTPTLLLTKTMMNRCAMQTYGTKECNTIKTKRKPIGHF